MWHLEDSRDGKQYYGNFFTKEACESHLKKSGLHKGDGFSLLKPYLVPVENKRTK